MKEDVDYKFWKKAETKLDPDPRIPDWFIRLNGKYQDVVGEYRNLRVTEDGVFYDFLITKWPDNITHEADFRDVIERVLMDVLKHRRRPNSLEYR